MIQVGGRPIHGCTTCFQCAKNKERVVLGSGYWNRGFEAKTEPKVAGKVVSHSDGEEAKGTCVAANAL